MNDPDFTDFDEKLFEAELITIQNIHEEKGKPLMNLHH